MNKLYISQKLLTTTNETVTIKHIRDDEIDVEYRGKIYTRNIDIIGKKLFLIENDANNSTHNKKIEKHDYSCMECRFQRNGDCFGKTQICKEFVYLKANPINTEIQQHTRESYNDRRNTNDFYSYYNEYSYDIHT